MIQEWSDILPDLMFLLITRTEKGGGKLEVFVDGDVKFLETGTFSNDAEFETWAESTAELLVASSEEP